MKKNILLFSIVLGMYTFGQTVTAANLNFKGTGQTLIYPYYTVNNDLNTLLSVVNTTEEVKAIKVRFLEGDNGQETLLLNVYLSPFDVWTAALSATTTGVWLTTFDNSCVPFLGNPQPFLEFAYVLDPGSDEEERERDGHFEILEMGIVTDPVLGPSATHVNGVPADCGALAAAWLPDGQWDVDPNDGLTPPTGGLYGNAIIVDVAEGTAVSYRAEAIDNFFAEEDINHTDPGNLSPNLSSAEPQSLLIDSNEAVVSNWSSGEDAISALFMHESLFGEYVLGSGINALTEWVVTFPTKPFYVNGNPLRAPFNESFGSEGACEPFEETFYDREEQTLDTSCPTMCPPSPQESLCWNSNVIHFYNSSIGQSKQSISPVLGSSNILSLNTNPFDSGQVILEFLNDRALIDLDNNFAYKGYPMTGFAVQTYTNIKAQPGLLAQYAAIFNHTYKRSITSSSD
ncbi:hypothetical protein [Marinicella sp. W31]|uniref:hypothetical protein n=1 Tax=Marinicella sp. W31 TaxID=3023713 RepID=UPI003756F137